MKESQTIELTDEEVYLLQGVLGLAYYCILQEFSALKTLDLANVKDSVKTTIATESLDFFKRTFPGAYKDFMELGDSAIFMLEETGDKKYQFIYDSWAHFIQTKNSA